MTKISRRSALGFIGATTAALATSPRTAAAVGSRHRYGLVTVESHYQHLKATGEFLRVYVHGVDITSRCFEADDIKGYAMTYCGDQLRHEDYAKDGPAHLGLSGNACEMRIIQEIEIRPCRRA